MSPTPHSSNAARLPRRPYGKTGVELSILGAGGILVMKSEQAAANRVVAEAVERGVNYFDVAPTYGDAEARLGPALAPYRQGVFLACKTIRRGRDEAAAHLRQSLANLRTDHLDLYQLHGLSSVAEDVDSVFARGGAMEVLLEAKRSGQVRFLGFSAHTEEAALAALDRYDFDSVLFPVNWASWLGGFGPKIMAAAERHGAARLALKALARREWAAKDPAKATWTKCWYEPITDRRLAELALRFTLSLPVTAAIPPGEETLFRLALDIATDYRPISDEEAGELQTLAESVSPLFPQTA
jgi:predicted aldo/keto reductase-like oxidoreductase